ncbi:SLAC1 anion channel family protein [Marinilabiliaceae bacterium ANBcel2]|nr:SLAC1 anion channel family protein [Marinilabiliaceae bacterium ANBcel2]
MNDKIKNFPISGFTVIMGLSGLTLVFSKFAELGWLSPLFYYSALIVVSLFFVVIAFMYLMKFLMHKDEVKQEYTHPVKINFFPAISISLLLLSIAFEQYSTVISQYLWWPGVILHTFFMFKAVSYWIEHNYQINHFNPAWFIPAVGNVLVPVSAGVIIPEIVNYFYFSSGIFFWIILFAIFINRVVFYGQLPQKFIPTFFILIAPPAVGFVSYMKIFDSWDPFSMFLLMMGMFFLLLLMFMIKSFTRLKFYMSWWAFTFPLTAITVAMARAYEVTGEAGYMNISKILAVIAVIVIAIVAFQTFKSVSRGEICVMEEE